MGCAGGVQEGGGAGVGCGCGWMDERVFDKRHKLLCTNIKCS